MNKAKILIGAMLALLWVGGSASASVLVSYDLTFTGANASDDGTGILQLNLPSFPDNSNINYTSLPNAIFSSLTATIGTLPTFTLTDSNIAFGGVQGTNSSSIDVAVTEATTGFSVGKPYLSIYNDASNAGTYTILPYNQGGTDASGSYTIGAPFIATAVPEPATWSMMIGALLGMAFLSRPRRKQTA